MKLQTISRSAGFTAVTVCLLILAVSFVTFAARNQPGRHNSDQWQMAGRDIGNSRNQPGEHEINSTNVGTLTTKWVFETESDVSATPTVSDGVVYAPDWSGHLYAVGRSDGKLLWSHEISEYNNYPGSISRVSPAVHKDDLIFGDIEDARLAHNGANVIAVSQQDGKLRWITHVESHPAAIITGAPVVYGDTVYVGVSSIEEALAAQTGYPCCSFRGSIVALNANNGQILWRTYTTPDNRGAPDGYSGNAVWQPPSVDPVRGSLFVGTGNNYEVPSSVKSCLANTAAAAKSTCFTTEDYFDTALSLDLSNGKVKWATRLQGVDVWTVACINNPNPVACPLPDSPDYDLGGSGPNLLPNAVGFGQKSGIYWALNPDNGKIEWSTVVGPGATLGGIEWGTATDGQRIYAAVTNSGHKSYQLIDGRTITWGAWSALDARTGKILWQTPDPSQSLAMGSVSVANNVMYAPSISGNMHAIDAVTGKIVWTFASGGSVLDGPSIAEGMVFFGSGYRKTTGGIGNNKLYGLQLSGRSNRD